MGAIFRELVERCLVIAVNLAADETPEAEREERKMVKRDSLAGGRGIAGGVAM